ncbi:MAG: DNRLRE domain-containing protein, partial [Syntrophobacteraceae bacterium]
MKKVIARLASIAALLAVIAPPGAGAATTGSVDIGSAMDAHVVEGYSTSNYGSASSIYVQSASGGSYKDERAWTMFDLKGSLPAGATIVSAKLRLYCWKADDADDLSASVYGSDDDSWTESGLTWSGQPAYGSTALSSVELVANDEDKWIEWDVTAFVQAQYAGDGKVSLVVKPAAEGQSSYAAYVFDAKEYSSSLAPRLRIEYTGEWPTDGAFKIFHINDTHSRLLPHEFDFPDLGEYPVCEKAGGAAYLATEMIA